MPAAPSVLTETERKALAEYVISLGPPPDPVAIAETELFVADRRGLRAREARRDRAGRP
jgi:hypothetical protein